jgi:hypothetical protein
MLNLEKFVLCEKHDVLSYSHNKMIDDHIMLDVAHEVVLVSLNSYQPHTCTCAHLENILPCANPCCSKESQSLIKQKFAGRIKRNKRKMRRTRHAQPPQDIHGCVVKRLEKGETT